MGAEAATAPAMAEGYLRRSHEASMPPYEPPKPMKADTVGAPKRNVATREAEELARGVVVAAAAAAEVAVVVVMVLDTGMVFFVDWGVKVRFVLVVMVEPTLLLALKSCGCRSAKISRA
eukprot:6191449-Pleurochrysis_carterae.AAC.3